MDRKRIVLIAGAGSSGPGWSIGKACSVAFARRGYHVVAVDSVLAAAEETAGIIRSEGGTCDPMPCDVADEAAVAALGDAVLQAHGGIDVLFDNVGIGKVAGPLEVDPQEWDRIQAVNVKSLLYLSRAFLPSMVEARRGVILATSSIAGQRWLGFPHLAYAVSKAALIHFMKYLALQYAPHGIRAVTLVPGLMDTPRIAKTVAASYDARDLDEMRRQRDAQVPLGHMGNAWDVAHAAVFLASDEARYITATELVIDGGITAKVT